MKLFYALLPTIMAHLPLFPTDTCHIDTMQTKSWGVYLTIAPHTSQSCSFKAAVGESITVSASVPAQFYSPSISLNASLFGHNASSIKCKGGFNGWNPSGRRLLDSGLDSILYLPRHDSTVTFEPWGVGAYVSLFACDSVAPNPGDDNYVFEIRNGGNSDVPVSLGMAMEEDFSVGDLVRMPYLILRTWLWSDSAWYVYIIPHAIAVLAALGLGHGDFRGHIQHGTFAALFMFSNAAVFAARLIEVENANFLAVFLHVLLPLIVGVLLVRKPELNSPWVQCLLLLLPLTFYAGLLVFPAMWNFMIPIIVAHIIVSIGTFFIKADAVRRILMIQFPLFIYSLLFLWQAYWLPVTFLLLSWSGITDGHLRKPLKSTQISPRRQISPPLRL